ncbi:MAG: phosphate ABC transporter permease PstA [Acidimicrobiales bacterium]
MAAPVSMPPNGPGTALLQRSVHGKRRAKNTAATVWMWLSLLLALVPLGLVLFTLIQKGLGIFSWSFLTEDIPASSRRVGPGMGPAVVGTILVTFFAAALAVPLGILGAIYLNEYGGKGRTAALVRFMADVMTGVPSIVMGLFIYTVWVLNFGLSGFAGSLALACLMLPIVIRSTEEMLKLVPNELREASYALGNTKWRTILTVVLPAALPGITAGVMLAVARAAGETAPLLFTIGVIAEMPGGIGATVNEFFQGPFTALSTQIFTNAQTPYPGAQERAWGAAFTLVLIVFVLTTLARFISSRFSIQGSAT